jgi:hypothetical protein
MRAVRWNVERNDECRVIRHVTIRVCQGFATQVFNSLSVLSLLLCVASVIYGAAGYGFNSRR